MQALAAGPGLGRLKEWFGQARALAAARAQIAAEPTAERVRRERCRQLWDAAEQLSANGRSAPEAQRALHAAALSGEAAELPQGLEQLRERHAALLAGLEAPRRAGQLAWRRRLGRVGALLVVLAAIALGTWPLIEGGKARPNLLAGKTWTTSSTLTACKPEQHACAGATTDIFFHTNHDASPWIEYDLGAPTAFSRLWVRNRQDSLPERAVPLIAESSDDRKTWKELARREESFSEWTADFPPVTARYFRLRVDKASWLHLEAVELKP